MSQILPTALTSCDWDQKAGMFCRSPFSTCPSCWPVCFWQGWIFCFCFFWFYLCFCFCFDRLESRTYSNVTWHFILVNAPNKTKQNPTGRHPNGYVPSYLACGHVLRSVCHFGFLRKGTESSSNPWVNKFSLPHLGFLNHIIALLMIQLTFKNMYSVRHQKEGINRLCRV